MGGIGLEISWLESIIYGLIAGLAEILPVSSVAHQSILHSLFGLTDHLAYLRLCANLGALIALAFSLWPLYARIRRECRISRSKRRKKSKTINMQYVFDWNMVTTACIPLLLGGILYSKISGWQEMVPLISLFLAINGLVLHLPVYFPKGNKDSRTMSRLEGILLGIGSVLGYFPGISRIGVGFSTASIRGADDHQALKWSLLLSVPALAVMLAVDGYRIFAAGSGSPDTLFLLKCLLIAVSSCIGTSVGIRMMKKLLLRTSPDSFSYYCWGAALFSFILYLY